MTRPGQLQQVASIKIHRQSSHLKGHSQSLTAPGQCSDMSGDLAEEAQVHQRPQTEVQGIRRIAGPACSQD